MRLSSKWLRSWRVRLRKSDERKIDRIESITLVTASRTVTTEFWRRQRCLVLSTNVGAHDSPMFLVEYCTRGRATKDGYSGTTRTLLTRANASTLIAVDELPRTPDHYVSDRLRQLLTTTDKVFIKEKIAQFLGKLI